MKRLYLFHVIESNIPCFETLICQTATSATLITAATTGGNGVTAVGPVHESEGDASISVHLIEKREGKRWEIGDARQEGE